MILIIWFLTNTSNVLTMKSLVVYFSRDGNTRKVAEKLAEKIGADIEEVTESKSRAGPLGWIRSGRESASGMVPEINPVKASVSEYDLVIIGGAMWAGTICSPVRAFLVKYASDIKQSAIFCTLNGDKHEKAFAEMESRLGKEPVATAHFKANTIKDDSYLSDLDAFAEKIK